MSSQQPRLTIAKPVRANGVLSVPTSATQREPRRSSGPSIARTSTAPASRQKILIRRLPPGLTQNEFEEALGEEWRPGGDKVGWADYKPGKVSKDFAKPSRPSRSYLYVKKVEYVVALGDKIRATTFHDAKNSANDSCLLGPPSAEFAPFQKIPATRPRKDTRQSTIDQDPEFIDFLESLTSPITKSSTVDQDNESAKSKEKITVTPLIQFLKEKKANKGKEASNIAKSGKHGRQDSKGNKSAINANSKSTSVIASPNAKKRSAQAVKVEQAARDAVKVLNKQAAGAQNPGSPVPSTPNAKASASSVIQSITPNCTANAALADKKRERGNASAAAKILQRDLGLGGSPGNRGGKGVRGNRSGNETAASPTQQSSTVKMEQSTIQATSATQVKVDPPNKTADTLAEPRPASSANPTPTSPTTISTLTAKKAKSPPSGPAASRINQSSHSRNANPSTAANTTQASTQPPSASTQAFLKHANPSQGITEPLLSATFTPFGAIKKCEIDKKKGFAYIDFENPEGLQRAIKASPVKVAQGQVVVLERKIGGREQPIRNAATGGGAVGGGGNRGGNNVGGSRGSGNSPGGAGGVPTTPRGGGAGARGGGNARRRGSGGGGGGGSSRGGAANPPAGAKANSSVVNASPSPATASSEPAAENTAPLPSTTTSTPSKT